MQVATTRLTSLALIIALAAAVAGCGPSTPVTPASTTPDTTGASVATSTTAATPSTPVAPAPGPITAPATGSASRAAILQAVAKGLGVSGNITVYQLFTDSIAAVGDIQGSSGPRTFVALTGGPGAWKLAWTAPFGSSLANAKDLVATAPRVSAALAGKLDFKKIVKKPAAAPTLSSFKTFALKSARSFAGSTYTGSFAVTAKIAKDSSGAWWGNAVSEPATSGLEPIGVWGTYSGGKWTGEIADYSTDGADGAFFPADVLAKLAL